MKSKNFKKKLTLNKKTIADFEIPETRNIYGGIDSDPLCTGHNLTSMLYISCIDTECGCTEGCITPGCPPTTAGVPCKTC